MPKGVYERSLEEKARLRGQLARSRPVAYVRPPNSGRKALPFCKRGHPKTPDNVYCYGSSGGVCKECARLTSKERWAKFPEQRRQQKRSSYLKVQYGMTQAHYEQKRADQNGLCEICGQPDPSGTLRIDHDHETSKPRDLLCTNCNLALGLLRDDPALMEKAAGYIEGFRDV